MFWLFIPPPFRMGRKCIWCMKILGKDAATQWAYKVSCWAILNAKNASTDKWNQRVENQTQVPGSRRRQCIQFIRLPTITTFAMYFTFPSDSSVSEANTKHATYDSIVHCTRRDVAAAGFGCCAIDQSWYGKKRNEKQNESTLFRLARFNSGRSESVAQSAMQFRSFSLACIWTVDPATAVCIENTRHADPGAVFLMPKIISLWLCVWVCSFSFVRFAHHWPLFKMHAIRSFANPNLPTHIQTLVSLSVRIQLLAQTHSFHFNKWISLWID